MSNWEFCLAGMSENPALWEPRALLRYLLLLSVLDGLSGYVTARTVNQSEVFYLSRSGYRRWYRRLLWGNSVLVLGYAAAVFLLTVLSHGGILSEYATAAGIFGLSALTLTWAQTLLILLSGSMLIGFSSLVMVQLVSLYCSLPLLGTWKLLLPGNWAMALRSALASPNGFKAQYAVGIELALLLVMWLSGWRLVRRKKRKV